MQVIELRTGAGQAGFGVAGQDPHRMVQCAVERCRLAQHLCIGCAEFAAGLQDFNARRGVEVGIVDARVLQA